jgi:hypothetical protein
MQLPLQDFAALVRTQAAAVRGGAAGLIDLSVGSVLRAVLEANASVGLWVQWLIVQVLATTRAATSSGPDLDTWVGDFGVQRLPGTAARGQVRVGRGVPGLAATVPVGALVRTAGPGALTFRVAADPGHPAWTGAGYALAAADTDLVVPVLAAQPGGAGNVRPTAIVQLATAIPGVDRVTNDGSLLGGVDAEGDAALRTRFGGFIDSRTRATPGAVAWAVGSLRAGLSVSIAERVDTAGRERPGHFTVTVDDGTGLPDAALLAAAGAAIEAVRPVGSTYSVRGPLVLRTNVQLIVQGPGSGGPVQAAVIAWLAALPTGAGLARSRLVQVAHDADPTVASVLDVTINGLAADLVVPVHGLVRPGTVDMVLR